MSRTLSGVSPPCPPAPRAAPARPNGAAPATPSFLLAVAYAATAKPRPRRPRSRRARPETATQLPPTLQPPTFESHRRRSRPPARATARPDNAAPAFSPAPLPRRRASRGGPQARRPVPATPATVRSQPPHDRPPPECTRFPRRHRAGSLRWFWRRPLERERGGRRPADRRWPASERADEPWRSAGRRAAGGGAGGRRLHGGAGTAPRRDNAPCTLCTPLREDDTSWIQ